MKNKNNTSWFISYDNNKSQFKILFDVYIIVMIYDK